MSICLDPAPLQSVRPVAAKPNNGTAYSRLAEALYDEYARQVSAANQEETANNDQLAETLSREYVRQVNARESFAAFLEGSDAVISGSGFNEEIPWIDLKPVVMQESDSWDSARRAGKSIFFRGKMVKFIDLPNDFKQAFRDGLAKAAPEVKNLLRKQYPKSDYILVSDKHSHYRFFKHMERVGVVELGIGATPSTLAHELFHKIDAGRKFSRRLTKVLLDDYSNLYRVSGGDIKEYLLRSYPAAFGRIYCLQTVNLQWENRIAVSQIFCMGCQRGEFIADMAIPDGIG